LVGSAHRKGFEKGARGQPLTSGLVSRKQQMEETQNKKC
jgi:hypothetical protein